MMEEGVDTAERRALLPGVGHIERATTGISLHRRSQLSFRS